MCSKYCTSADSIGRARCRLQRQSYCRSGLQTGREVRSRLREWSPFASLFFSMLFFVLLYYSTATSSRAAVVLFLCNKIRCDTASKRNDQLQLNKLIKLPHSRASGPLEAFGCTKYRQPSERRDLDLRRSCKAKLKKRKSKAKSEPLGQMFQIGPVKAGRRDSNWRGRRAR